MGYGSCVYFLIIERASLDTFFWLFSPGILLGQPMWSSIVSVLIYHEYFLVSFILAQWLKLLLLDNISSKQCHHQSAQRQMIDNELAVKFILSMFCVAVFSSVVFKILMLASICPSPLLTWPIWKTLSAILGCHKPQIGLYVYNYDDDDDGNNANNDDDDSDDGNDNDDGSDDDNDRCLSSG